MRHSTPILTAALLFAVLSPSAWGQSPEECEKALLRDDPDRKLCVQPWQPTKYGDGVVGIDIEGYPYGDMTLYFFPEQDHHKLDLAFTFKARRDNEYNPLRPSGSSWDVGLKYEVRPRISFMSKVRRAEGGFSLQQDIVEWDDWAYRHWDFWKGKLGPDHDTAYALGDEAANLVRKMYHSESISWTDLKTGETNTAITESPARKAIREFQELCGGCFSLHESTP